MKSQFEIAIKRVKEKAEIAKQEEEERQRQEQRVAEERFAELERRVVGLNSVLINLRRSDECFDVSLKSAMHGRKHLFVTGDTSPLFGGRVTQNTTMLWIIERQNETGANQISGHGLLLVSNVSSREKVHNPAIRFVMTNFKFEVSSGYYHFSSIFHNDMLNPMGIAFANDVKQLSLGGDNGFLDCMVVALGLAP